MTTSSDHWPEEILDCAKEWSQVAALAMNSLPGVTQLESKSQLLNLEASLMMTCSGSILASEAEAESR